MSNFLTSFMGLRGPKPVNLEALKRQAQRWAEYLFTLRDGQRGLVQKVEWRPWQTVPNYFGPGKPLRHRSSKVLFAAVVVYGKEKEVERVAKGEDWVYSRPVRPRRDLWEQLKTGRSASDLRRTARSVGEWFGSFLPGGDWADTFPQVLHANAEMLIKARELPDYPRSDWASSDDRRVEFFAKVLGGRTLGMAPATTIKRLARWRSEMKAMAASVLADHIKRLEGEKGETTNEATRNL